VPSQALLLLLLALGRHWRLLLVLLLQVQQHPCP
jgi:hypothetical protein